MRCMHTADGFSMYTDTLTHQMHTDTQYSSRHTDIGKRAT